MEGAMRRERGRRRERKAVGGRMVPAAGGEQAGEGVVRSLWRVQMDRSIKYRFEIIEGSCLLISNLNLLR